MHHAKIVRDVVAWLQKALQQDQIQTETPTLVQAPVDHVTNAVRNTQQHLYTQMHQMKAMMKSMQMQYAAAPHSKRQYYGGLQDYGGRGYHGNQSSYCGQGEHGAQNNWNWRGGRGGQTNSNFKH